MSFRRHQNLPYEIRIAGKGKITYTYDNLGTKWKKIVVDSTTSPTPTTTTWLYMNNFVYKNDTMQFFSHEEGRARYDTTQTTGEATAFDYDYFLKDHLGNIRMVLTAEKDTIKYTPLTFEGTTGTAQVINQDAVWENKTGATINVVSARVTKPGPFDIGGNNGSYAMLVRKSTGSIGAAKLLKVMAGDQLLVKVDYYYTVTNANNTGASGITSLTANLASAIGASGQVSGALKDGASGITSALTGITALVNLLNTPNNTSGANNAPKAYLNIIAFDDQFKYDATASTVVPVPYGPGTPNTINLAGGLTINVAKNGFIYAYISNESDELVYFDNFTVTHVKGPILEDTHYYPFGLTMAGISSRALLKTENKYKFGGKELESKDFFDGSGIETYDFGARNYDPQIGRWHTLDPLADQMRRFSLYNYAFDNPIRFIDPDGMMSGPGDQFKNVNDAAHDFGETYNGQSIKNNYEIASTIYSYKVNGVRYYSYTPGSTHHLQKRSKPDPEPSGTTAVAATHTHGAYGEEYDGNNISADDARYATEHAEDVFVATPNGSLKKYENTSGKVETINTDLPSDHNDPTRQNKIPILEPSKPILKTEPLDLKPPPIPTPPLLNTKLPGV